MKKKQVYINVADTDTGEYYKLVKNKVVTSQHGRFIKFYIPLIILLPSLTATQLTIITYTAVNLKINKHTILLTPELCKLSKSAFYRACVNLIKYNVLSKSQYPNIYNVNPEYLANGKR